MRRGVFLILAVLAPLVAGCALNPPRIVSIAPNREATEVPTNQAISISFDRPMNHESVETRFALKPALSGCSGSNNCRFAWSGNTLTYIHTHVNFDLSTAYTVSMHAGYADASGQQNTLEHSWRFITEGRPSLTAVDPADNASAVAPDRNIILTFSRPMRPDSIHAAVQVSPDVPFLLRPKPGGDGSQFEIIPTAMLQPNQSYTVSIDQPLDVHDNAIYGRVQTRFRSLERSATWSPSGANPPSRWGSSIPTPTRSSDARHQRSSTASAPRARCRTPSFRSTGRRTDSGWSWYRRRGTRIPVRSRSSTWRPTP